MLIVTLVAVALVALAHTLPAPFALDALAGDRAVWFMPRTDPPTVYLTFDDGPNPSTTPDLLDVLAGERIRATFFLIDAHVTDTTAPIVRRIFSDGHSAGIHTSSRRFMLMSPGRFAREISAAAARLESIGGRPPCRAFRPHAGWRSGRMYEGLRRLDYRLIGWGWMLWDFNWFRARTAEAAFRRISHRVSAGDIIVMHDGDESARTRDQRHTVEATRRLIPELRRRGFVFGTIC